MSLSSVVRGAPRGEFRFAIAHNLPPGSTIPVSLQALSRRWMDVLGDKMELTFLPPIPGGDGVLLRRITINQVQGAVIGATGLGMIDPAASAFQALPLLWDSWRAFDEARDRVRPTLEDRAIEKGYQILLWGEGGWLRWFSNKPLTSPADLKALRIAGDGTLPTWADDAKRLGTAVEVAPNKLGAAMAAGEVDAVLIPTSRAVDLGIAKAARSVLDLKWAPVVQALVMSYKAWERVPSEVRRRARSLAENIAHEIRANLRAEDDAAMTRLTDQFDLRVVTPGPETLADWNRIASDLRARARGTAVPEAVHDQIVGPIDAVKP